MSASSNVIDRAIKLAADSLVNVQSGSVLYSGLDSLAPSPIYVMGFNPGGSPEDNLTSVAADLQRTLHDLPPNWCAYTDGQWERGKRMLGKGEHPHQRGFQKLARSLGLVPARIPAANAIFCRTASAGEVDDHVEFDRCWPIHALFLEVIRPAAIVCIGNGRTHSSFACLVSRFGPVTAADPFAPPFRQGRSFVITEMALGAVPPLRDVLVVGLPHFSHFPFNPSLPVIEQLRQRIVRWART